MSCVGVLFCKIYYVVGYEKDIINLVDFTTSKNTEVRTLTPPPPPLPPHSRACILYTHLVKKIWLDSDDLSKIIIPC